ncbi:MAG: hypothetical protein RI883_1811 [Bacteroidota bacterium]
MNKICFILLVLTITSLRCYGQNYFHSPNDTLITNTSIDGQVTMNITQVHPNNDTLHFNWNKLDVIMPFGWEANICDNSYCYTSLVDSGTTLPVLPGDDGLMLIHCTPHITEGTAIIRYTISEENTPLQIDTLTWIINATVAGINSTISSFPKIWVNNNQLHIEELLGNFSTLVIYNSLGQIAFDAQINYENIIQLPALIPSIYFIKLVGEHSVFSQKIKLTE